MADATELEFVRTLLGAICTTSTVKHIDEHGGNVHSITDASSQKMLVKQGELINSYSDVYVKRFKVVVTQPTEALLQNTIRSLIDGIRTFQKRDTIATYTYESTFIWIELVSINVGKIHFKAGKRWDNEIIIDCKFTTS